MRSELREDLTRLAVGLGLVAAVAIAFVIGHERGVTVPIGYTLLATLGVALVAGPTATAIVSLATCVVCLLSYAVETPDTWVARYLTIVGICVLATMASVVRRRRERALLAKTRELAIAQDHEITAQLTQHMLERVPQLTQAGDIPGVARQAVRIGRELFAAAAVSYWQVDGNECYLVARDPLGAWPLGHRLPVATMSAAGKDARTAYTRRRDLAEDDPRVEAMIRSGDAMAGTSTTIRVDGATVAFLAMSWTDDDQPASPAWFDLLDRFADQVALAKTVVRRRAAQEQARVLGARLQRAMLPTPIDEADGVVTRWLYRPGTRDLLLGGDFFDLAHRESSDGRIAFLLGDVSGHGPEQAAIAASLRSAWSAMAAFPQLGLDDWAHGLQHALRDGDPEQTLFVTVVMGVVAGGGRELQYVTAGHPPPILLRRDGPVVGSVDGPPLGVVDDLKLEVVTLDLDGCDGVLLVTDGIFEGRESPGGHDRVGYDEFVQIAAAEPGLSSPDYLRRLADGMTERNGGPLDDDVAALLMLLPASDPPPPPA
jgi:serine phosphatase RsbU (regulator of sigma subunit)